MAIDFGSDNTSRYYSVPDHADFTLPNDDWAWVVLFNPSSLVNYSYLVSSGGYGASNSINLGSYISGSGGFFLKVHTLAEKKWTGGNPVVGTWYWAYATRRSGNLYTGAVPLNGSTASESTATAIASAYDSANAINIGRRSGGASNEYTRGQIGITAFVSGAGITEQQAIELARGAPLLSMPFAPSIKAFWHGRTANDATIADLISGHVATRQGTSYGSSEEDAQTPYIWTPLYVNRTASSAASYSLIADAGSTSYSGGAVTLAWNRKLSAEAALFLSSGAAATLTKTSGVTLAADAGSFVSTFTAATLRAARRLSSDVASFSYTGAAASLNYNTSVVYTLSAGEASFGFTGAAVSFIYQRVMPAEGSEFAGIFGDATLTYKEVIVTGVWEKSLVASSSWALNSAITSTWS